MVNEKKYIIVKNKLNNRLHHYISEINHHCIIARINGYTEDDIVESGLFLEKRLYILDCNNEKHLLKHKSDYIGNRLNQYEDIRLQNYLKARELESMLYYSKKSIGLKNGD